MLLFPIERSLTSLALPYLPLYLSLAECWQYVQREQLPAPNLGPSLHTCWGWAEISSQPWLWLPVLPVCVLRKKSECILPKLEFASGLECTVTRSCLKSQTWWWAALLGITFTSGKRGEPTFIHAALPRSLSRLSLESLITSDGLH